MLGMPVEGWLRFFACGLAAGALVLFAVPAPPVTFLAAFVMGASCAGLLFVAVYARLYAPYRSMRVGVRLRRFSRSWHRWRDLARRRARVVHPPWAGRALLGNRESGTPP